MTFKTLRLHNALKTLVESVEADSQGISWGQLYIANIDIKGMTRHEIAGHIAELTRRGLYRVIDGNFGLVRM